MPGNSVNIQFLPIQDESRKAVINPATTFVTMHLHCGGGFYTLPNTGKAADSLQNAHYLERCSSACNSCLGLK